MTTDAGGIETHPSPLPEGVVCLPDLTIGGKTTKELEEMLASGGIKVSDCARSMLRGKDFATLPDQKTLSLVRVKVSDLGLTGYPTIDQIYAKANELGLDLCPVEVGPWLRLASKDQPLNDWFYIGMKQITDRGGYPFVFELERSEDGLWLDGDWAEPDDGWDPRSWFVFSLRK